MKTWNVPTVERRAQVHGGEVLKGKVNAMHVIYSSARMEGSGLRQCVVIQSRDVTAFHVVICVLPKLKEGKQHLLVNPESGVQVEVCKRETVHEGAASSQGNVSSHDVNTHYEQLEQPTHQYRDFSDDKKVVKNELISSPRLENHCEGAYKIMMKEGTEDGFLTRSTSAPGALVETQHEDTPSRGNSFDLLGNTHEDENVLVFRSL
nr:unnamed protein product [Haemonchus contortus]